MPYWMQRMLLKEQMNNINYKSVWVVAVHLIMVHHCLFHTDPQGIPYSRLFSCRFNFRTAGACRKLDFEKFFLPI